MKNWWVKLGCFLTGFNYNMINSASEVAVMKVKQTISALLIVIIIWAFVGYIFTYRYLNGNTIESLVGSLMAIIVVVQIERQIILSIDPGKILFGMRIFIAVLMAIIGSVIIDQVIFKADIEKRKITILDYEVNKIYPLKSNELRSQIRALDSTILVKEAQRIELDNEISRKPTINIYSNQTNPLAVPVTVTDSMGKATTKMNIVNTRSTSVTSTPNPKIDMVKPLDDQITSLRSKKMEKDEALLVLRSSLEKEIKSKVGFLDELRIMFDILNESAIAFGVWVIWFFILFGLELFILASKMGEKSNVYEETLKHQERVLKRKLQLLSEGS